MMHNLGLGGLEFSPNHAVEEHHPEGYRTFEEGLQMENGGVGELLRETESTHEYHFEPSTTTTERSSSKHVLEIKINDKDESEEIVLVKESQRGSQAEDKITVRVTNSDTEEKSDDQVAEKEIFISMHDPKHRHPSYKGE